MAHLLRCAMWRTVPRVLLRPTGQQVKRPKSCECSPQVPRSLRGHVARCNSSRRCGIHNNSCTRAPRVATRRAPGSSFSIGWDFRHYDWGRRSPARLFSFLSGLRAFRAALRVFRSWFYKWIGGVLSRGAIATPAGDAQRLARCRREGGAKRGPTRGAEPEPEATNCEQLTPSPC